MHFGGQPGVTYYLKSTLGTDHYFPQGGYRDWEKRIVCMRKNAEINCLPQRCIWEKIVCRGQLCYARFGEFKQIVCTARVEEKTCKHSIDGGKNFLPPRNHDTPPPGENNGPSLSYKTLENN